MKRMPWLLLISFFFACQSDDNDNPCDGSNLSVSITQNQGGLTATGSGGETPYTFLWSNGVNGAVLSDPEPGEYTVTITDAAGCSDSSTATVTSNCTGLSTYPQVVIGSQVWMQKNLDVCHYRNGDPIPQITNCEDWIAATQGAWCYVNFDPQNGPLYGKIYNQYAVADSRGLAPTGWHIPNQAEWTTLDNFLGGFGVAGGKMKSVSGWNSPNVGATNSSGFSALPGGTVSREDCVLNHFVGTTATFWMYPWEEDSQGIVIYRGRSLENYHTATDDIYYPHSFDGFSFTIVGLSVRCVKD